MLNMFKTKFACNLKNLNKIPLDRTSFFISFKELYLAKLTISFPTAFFFKFCKLVFCWY